jgi:hypothetical protein
MNYLKLFNGAVGLFPKMIKVKLIDAATGHLLDKHKIPAEQLPAAFNKPTILIINNANWRIIKADPVLADDFLFKKKLTLHVREAGGVNAVQNLFSTPTICHEQPLTGVSSLYNNFTLALAADDWRQLEFLPLQQWTRIEEEIKTVENILDSHPNALLGYEQQYRREKTASLLLNIPWKAFYALLPDPVAGNICYNDSGFVQDGFALRTVNHMYYGTLRDGIIQNFCLYQYDGVDDELMQVLETFKLILTDWCNISTISAELGEKTKSELINIFKD